MNKDEFTWPLFTFRFSTYVGVSVKKYIVILVIFNMKTLMHHQAKPVGGGVALTSGMWCAPTHLM